jgi:hypothetical protein
MPQNHVSLPAAVVARNADTENIRLPVAEDNPKDAVFFFS